MGVVGALFNCGWTPHNRFFLLLSFTTTFFSSEEVLPAIRARDPSVGHLPHRHSSPRWHDRVLHTFSSDRDMATPATHEERIANSRQVRFSAADRPCEYECFCGRSRIRFGTGRARAGDTSSSAVYDCGRCEYSCSYRSINFRVRQSS